MLYVNWRFTLIALSVVPVLFAVVYYLTRQIKQASRAVRKKESELTSIVEEALTSVRVVKAFAREDYEVQRFESESLENVETALRARSLKAKLVAARGSDRGGWNLSGAVVRRATGAGRPDQRRRSDRVLVVSRQDVQAHARSFQRDGHGFEGDRRLRTHSGGAGNRKPRSRSAARAARSTLQGENRIRPCSLQLRRRRRRS